MTESQKSVAEIQNEVWLKVEKQNCKKISLEHASKVVYPNPNGLLDEAKKIYDWLIEDLK